jgi:hypothetical protein
MEDLTIESFAYLRLPLALAALAFAIGSIGNLRAVGQRAFLAATLMMLLFFHAARLAMVVFDPYLSSRPLAEALQRSPAGTLVVNHHYYTYSSIFFYTNRTAWLLNGRVNNLIYGAYAPGAPNVFLDDAQWRDMWLGPQRCYLVADDDLRPHFEDLAGKGTTFVVARSGGKMLVTNQPL